MELALADMERLDASGRLECPGSESYSDHASCRAAELPPHELVTYFVLGQAEQSIKPSSLLLLSKGRIVTVWPWRKYAGYV